MYVYAGRCTPTLQHKGSIELDPDSTAAGFWRATCIAFHAGEHIPDDEVGRSEGGVSCIYTVSRPKNDWCFLTHTHVACHTLQGALSRAQLHPTLRTLLTDPRPCVAGQASVIAQGLVRLRLEEDYLDLSEDRLVEVLVGMRLGVAAKCSSLSSLDAVLTPLLELRCAIFLAQPIEDQMEPSELDLVTFGITAADLHQVAFDLGCAHLQSPQESQSQPNGGCVVGPKKRILVVRYITICGVTRCVTFLLDTGALASMNCAESLAAGAVQLMSMFVCT